MSSFREKLAAKVAAYFDRSAFWQRVFGRVMMNSTVIPAKIYPHTETGDVWWTEMKSPPDASSAPDAFAVPPKGLWEGYGRDATQYLASGRVHVTRMLEILAGSGFQLDGSARILDFGCSAGRMVRWFAPHAKGREIWGVDIASEPIHWAVQHLSPPFYFAVNTTLPPLPFDANSFDLIYCGSVFTHIADLADLWLVELRRLLKPGGFLYATVHDKHSVHLLRHKHSTIALSRSLDEANRRTGCADANFAKMVLARSPKGAQVFYDLEFLRSHWGRLLEIVTTTEEAYGYQTAVVMRKR